MINKSYSLSYWICLIQACIAVSFSYGQQPAYFVLGGDELKGVQVYDIIQDLDKNYWIASNEGIFRYNYLGYERVGCKEARSNSAFNFVMDAKGRIFCHNLNNQVFRIENGVCSLFYTLKEDEGGGDVSLAIADDGSLLVSSRKIIALDENGHIRTQKSIPHNYIGPPFVRTDKQVSYHLGSSNKVISYSNGKFIESLLSNKSTVLRFVKVGTDVFAVDLDSKAVFKLDRSFSRLFAQKAIPELKRSQSVRVYETKTGIWLAGTLPGVVHLSSSFVNNAASIFYQDYFISDVYVDQEGNTLLATFDNGILVVPDLKMHDVIGSFQKDPATSLLMDGENLLIGTSKGLLQRYTNNSFQILNKLGNRPVEVLAGNEEVLIFDDGYIRALYKRTGKIIDVLHASLKAVCYLGNGEFLLGTNRGVFLVDSRADKISPESIDALKDRVHRMAYDPQQRLVYISTSEGLFTRDVTGVVKRLTFKGKDLFPNDLIYENGKVFMVLREGEILQYEGRDFQRMFVPRLNGETIQLKKIRLYQHGFIGSALTGLYEFDLKGNVIRTLHQGGGFSSKRIIDFVISKDVIWVSHSGGVQKFNLKNKDRSATHSELRIDQVRVNGKNRNFDKKLLLEANERTLFISFVLPTLRNRETIRYHYRLIGADTNWTVNNYDQNHVTYSAMSPGSYVFQLKCEQNGKFSQLLNLPFEIKKPFYLTWWFISFGMLIFLGIIFLFYRRKLRQQNRKAELINELHASKLTAIQSQMNPHFIFNSLNSIQDLVLQGDAENSYTYISSFSDMVRRTLNYSDKEFITFEQEIRLLELYLSLEQLRFPTDFKYTIDWENLDDLLIPPLLIQPFIENSLVHGLLHRKGQKILKVTFKLDHDKLICVIEDNGIGRVESRKIRDRQMADHESFSGEAIRKRFEILSDLYTGEFGYNFEDLYENGVACGTRVTLKIPVRLKY